MTTNLSPFVLSVVEARDPSTSPSTTLRANGIGRGAVKIARAVALVALVLGTWTLVMIAMPFIGPGGRQVAVIGDGPAAVRAIAAAGGSVVEVRRGATLARSDHPGFVWALYVAGASLVIEGRIAAGCFSKEGA